MSLANDGVPQQDFPFQIRIPESVPPSIALESRGYSYLDPVHQTLADCPLLSWNQVRIISERLHQG